MVKRTYHIPLRPDQRLRYVPFGDVHWDTPECDRPRVKRFVKWVQEREAAGEMVRISGQGDYLDFGSPSERALLTSGKLHETTNAKLDRAHLRDLKELVEVLRPIKHTFLGLLTGHHEYVFTTRGVAGDWQGRSSDRWLAHELGCDYWGNGIAYIRMQFPPRNCKLDLLAWHGAGGAQTPGGRVQKRIRVSEIAPTAHIVVVGHDNAKLVYPRSGLDYDHGKIKRYVLGSGSFQRAYLEGEEAGYAERMGLIPADLGVVVVDIMLEQRGKQWRVDYHASS